MTEVKPYIPSTFRPLDANDADHQSELARFWHLFWNMPATMAADVSISPHNIVVQILNIAWQLCWSFVGVMLAFGWLLLLHEKACARIVCYSKLCRRLQANQVLNRFISELLCCGVFVIPLLLVFWPYRGNAHRIVSYLASSQVVLAFGLIYGAAAILKFAWTRRILWLALRIVSIFSIAFFFLPAWALAVLAIGLILWSMVPRRHKTV